MAWGGVVPVILPPTDPADPAATIRAIYFYHAVTLGWGDIGYNYIFYCEQLIHGGMTNPLNSWTVPAEFTLEAAETYSWRVRPRVQGDGTPVAWSKTWSFRTP